jgi:hypothetical protein
MLHSREIMSQLNSRDLFGGNAPLNEDLGTENLYINTQIFLNLIKD